MDPAPKEGAAAISPDGKKFALPFASWFYVIDLEPSKDEAAYRESMSRLKPWWHDEQASRCEKEKAWYAEAYHLSWVVKANPNPENQKRFNAACQTLHPREVATITKQAGLNK